MARKLVREFMIFWGLASAAVAVTADRRMNSVPLVMFFYVLILGFLAGLLSWGVYRLGRFVF